ncbi:MAG TPA: glycine cleavage system protein H [Methylibium sp.]
MNIAGFEFPEELHYLVPHDTWARLDADGLVRVGITSLGVHMAGELYMCRPQPMGREVEAGRSIAVVELAKSIVSVKSPLSGTVAEVNAALEDHPELVYRDCYRGGWLARLRPADWARDRQGLVTGGAAIAAAMRRQLWLHGLTPEP